MLSSQGPVLQNHANTETAAQNEHQSGVYKASFSTRALSMAANNKFGSASIRYILAVFASPDSIISNMHVRSKHGTDLPAEGWY